MPDISSLGHGSVGPVDRVSSPSPVGRRQPDEATQQPAPPPSRPGDRVELSDHARYLDRLRQLPEVRNDRIDHIRDAIADGSYVTPEKLDAALDRLIDDALGS